MAGIALDNANLTKVFLGTQRINNLKINNLNLVAVPQFLGSFKVGGVTSANLSGLNTTLRAGDIVIVFGSSGSTQLPAITGYSNIYTSASIVRFTAQYKVMPNNPDSVINGLAAHGSYIIVALRNVDATSLVKSLATEVQEYELDEETGAYEALPFSSDPNPTVVNGLTAGASYLVLAAGYLDHDKVHQSQMLTNQPTNYTLAEVADSGTSASSTMVAYRFFDGNAPASENPGPFNVDESISYGTGWAGVTIAFRSSAGLFDLLNSEDGGATASPVVSSLTGTTISTNIDQFDSVGASAQVVLTFGSDGSLVGTVNTTGATLSNTSPTLNTIWYDSV